MGERPENETSINKKEDTPCEELPSAVEYLSATLTREREVRGKRGPGRTPALAKREREAEQQEEEGGTPKAKSCDTDKKERKSKRDIFIVPLLSIFSFLFVLPFLACLQLLPLAYGCGHTCAT